MRSGRAGCSFRHLPAVSGDLQRGPGARPWATRVSRPGIPARIVNRALCLLTADRPTCSQPRPRLCRFPVQFASSDEHLQRRPAMHLANRRWGRGFFGQRLPEPHPAKARCRGIPDRCRPLPHRGLSDVTREPAPAPLRSATGGHHPARTCNSVQGWPGRSDRHLLLGPSDWRQVLKLTTERDALRFREVAWLRNGGVA